MGLLCCFKQLDAGKIDELIKKPRKLQALLVGDEANDEVDDPTETDIGKFWHAIHYLMTGKPDKAKPPLDFLFYGGEDASGADFGYGDGHVFRPDEVKRIAIALRELKIGELRRRFDPAKMNRAKLYLGPFGADSLKHILPYFKDMREFIQRSAKQGDGLVVYFS